MIVEGGSIDDTWPVAQEVATQLAQRNDLVRVLAIQQDGRGKFDAVRKGFEASTGDVLAILDGDLAVAPEVLGDFISPVLEGEADVVIGDRLTLGMERGAMRSLNYLANIFLATVITRIGQRTVKDSLCGTKVLLREDWNQILANFSDLVDEDPFGDYSIILGSVGLGRQILNVPTVYRARTYGETNILRFRDGLKLMKVLASWNSRLADVASVQLVRAV
jgi:glycosyltransferase involved in cell wall biosynthesis